jgi:hypothetical protein
MALDMRAALLQFDFTLKHVELWAMICSLINLEMGIKRCLLLGDDLLDGIWDQALNRAGKCPDRELRDCPWSIWRRT